MRPLQYNPLDFIQLKDQIRRQEKYAWNLETSIPWKVGIELDKPFLPLDANALVFPGANEEQRLALSQFTGLVINASVAEMENVIVKLREIGCESLLRQSPVNPEMQRLGELFFQEEEKHSHAFYRFIDQFCQESGINREMLDLILPKAFGSFFLKAIILNARAGGFSFWWVVAAVEEVSIQLYKDIHPHRHTIDPLFHIIHLKHMEEESRHHNYAFLMLNLMQRLSFSPKRFLHKKTDLILAQTLSTAWVLGELQKIERVKKLKQEHRFFRTLYSCLELMHSQSYFKTLSRLFVEAPFISLMINAHHHKKTMAIAHEQGAMRCPFPKPLSLEKKAA